MPERGAIYRELLGAKPIVNAGGNLTFLGGSTPSAEVMDAMEQANSSFIPQDELQEKAGSHVAALLGVPAAMVTTGCASGLCLAAAAAMAGDSPKFIQQLPHTEGMPRTELLIQHNQRYHYDRAFEFAGASLVEYGGPGGATEAELVAAIGPRTAAVVFVGGGSRDGGASYVDRGPVLPFAELVVVCRKHDIPVVVDAAVEVFPLANMTKYVDAGAAVQVMALKYINAPQSTGVAVGSAEFVRRMKLHTFMAFETPHFGPDAWGANEGEFVAFNNAWHVRGIGRTHKVTRADMVGALVALDAWVARDHAARLTEAHKQCERLCEALAGVPGVQTTIDETNTESFDAYGVDIALDSAVLGEGDDGLDAMEMIARLKSGEPSIWARPTRRDSAGPMEVHVSVYSLFDGEEAVVAREVATLARQAAEAWVTVAATVTARL